MDMQLSGIMRRFIQHWGDMGGRWGANRTVAQIHALLYLIGGPVHAEDMADTLAISRSNVSNSVKELQSLSLAKRSHVLGARREFYEATQDVWELLRVVMQGRKERELEPTLQLLRELIAVPEFASEDAEVRQRLAAMLEMLELVDAALDVIAQAKPEKLARLAGMTSALRQFLVAEDTGNSGGAN